MGIVLLTLKLLIAFFTAFFLISLLKQNIRAKAIERYARLKQVNLEKLKQSQKKSYAYTAMEQKMLASGIKYRMGTDFSPFDYMCLRLLLGTAGGVVGLIFHPLLCPVAFIAVYVLIPYYFKQEDNNDNERMLSDIGQMNSLVALQVKNGVFISKVIYECYRNVANPRLKQALLELSIDMENFTSVKQAAVLFREKFNNPYIDSFSKILEQVQDTGKSIEFFEDIVKSVEGINEAIALTNEHKAERTASIFQVLLFIGPLALMFYLMLGMFTNASMGMF